MSNGVRVCVCMRVQRGIVNVFEPVCCAVTLYVYIICIYNIYLRESEGSDDGMKKKRKKKERKIRRRNSRAGRRTTVDLSESEQGTQVGV